MSEEIEKTENTEHVENTESIMHVEKPEKAEKPERIRKEKIKHEEHEVQHKEEPFDLLMFIKDSVSIITGIAFATIGLEGFIVPNKLLDGGVTGISLLLSDITKLDVSIFIFGLNLPFIFMGYKQVSKLFAYKE